jgi:aerobic carbon-monoxide dehydrogenase medium subunit
MKPAPFTLFSPETLPSALNAKAEYQQEAYCLAGGQSLIASMNFRCLEPAVLIDLNTLPELDYVHLEPDGEVKIGAMTRQSTLEHNAVIREVLPLMYTAIPYIAHTAIRSRGTIGGSLSYADPAGEQPTITMALSARYKAASSRGERWIDSTDFFIDSFQNALAPDEILVEIAIPEIQHHSGWGFQETARRQGDRVMMGVAALVQLDANGICRGARLVYMNAASTPFNARRTAEFLTGETASLPLIEAAAENASKEIEPLEDVHASVNFRRHLASELTRRALQQAFERAGQN